MGEGRTGHSGRLPGSRGRRQAAVPVLAGVHRSAGRDGNSIIDDSRPEPEHNIPDPKRARSAAVADGGQRLPPGQVDAEEGVQGLPPERLDYGRRHVRKSYDFVPIDRSDIDGRFVIKFDGYSFGSDGNTKGRGFYGAFEIAGCKGVPELTRRLGNYKPVLQPEWASVGKYVQPAIRPPTAFMKMGLEVRPHPRRNWNVPLATTCRRTISRWRTRSHQPESLRFTHGPDADAVVLPDDSALAIVLLRSTATGWCLTADLPV